jgi:hypothetical protein
MAVDGIAASRTLLGFESVTPGYCLHYVWRAYAAHGATSSTTYPTAYSAWQASRQQVRGDMNPPAGFPVYLGPRAGSSAGDVMISVGNGFCAATDWTRNGITGTVSIPQRLAQTNRPYLGWTRDFLGNAIQGAGQSPTPTPPIERMDTMKGASYPRSSDGVTVFLLFNDESGWWSEHSGVDAGYNNTIARNWATGSWSAITEGHARNIKAGLDRTRQGV